MIMKIKTILLLIATFICVSLQAQLSIPDAKKFLPGPPEETSVEYLKDYSQYVWGKSQRTSADWQQQALGDMNYQLSTFINAFSPLVGLPISKSNTPNIHLVLDYIMTYGQNTIDAAKNAYTFSLRPYAKFKENSLVPIYESEYADISTYPSSYSFMGWLMALTLIEICPDKQDPILARGYSFGTSSIIAGYNWDSDAISGRLLACAMTAILHNHSNFNVMIKAARQEYEKKTGIKNIITIDMNSPTFPLDNLPDATKYLPNPPALGTVLFAYDINQHIKNSKKRSTSEGKSAIEDIALSFERMCTIYSTLFGKTISQTITPHIYKLMERVFFTGGPACDRTKEKYVRMRPYYQFNEETADGLKRSQTFYENLFEKTSYPSGHSSQAWLTAMVLAEINPSQTETLLARAYRYGQSRVITGYHWQSDVDSGRLLASVIYAHLHANEEFMKMMELAKKEFSESAGT